MAFEGKPDLEMDSICLHESKPKVFSWQQPATANFQEDDIDVGNGLTVHVVVSGDRSKPAIMTYHDIGLSSVSCFQGFFNYSDLQPLLKHFCVYHVNAPGQHEGAPKFPDALLGMKHSESENLLNRTEPLDLKRLSLGVINPDVAVADGSMYPSMEELSEMLSIVVSHYSLRNIIGFGVGAGANILSRFALNHPEKVDALVLINCSATRAGWIEWAYQKWNIWYLKSGQLTASVEDYLIWHWFGQRLDCANYDLLMAYTNYIKSLNPHNLGHFIESYIRRTDLGMVRELDPLKADSAKNFKCLLFTYRLPLRNNGYHSSVYNRWNWISMLKSCPVMLITGQDSPHCNDTVTMNGLTNPEKSTWIKFDCGGMVLEEVPEKVAESFLFFLQGLGYVPTLRHNSISGQKP